MGDAKKGLAFGFKKASAPIVGPKLKEFAVDVEESNTLIPVKRVTRPVASPSQAPESTDYMDDQFTPKDQMVVKVRCLSHCQLPSYIVLQAKPDPGKVLSARQVLEEGLATFIPEENKGFAMLAKMGYKCVACPFCVLFSFYRPVFLRVQCACLHFVACTCGAEFALWACRKGRVWSRGAGVLVEPIAVNVRGTLFPAYALLWALFLLICCRLYCALGRGSRSAAER